MGILGNIAKRELSGVKKKEDEINLFDRDRFRDYFESHYECVFKYGAYNVNIISSGTGRIEYLQIPVLSKDRYLYSIAYVFKDMKPDKLIIRIPEGVYNSLEKSSPDFFKKYTMMSGTSGYEIYYSEILTNRFVLNFIDDIIELGDDRVWKKK